MALVYVRKATDIDLRVVQPVDWIAETVSATLHDADGVEVDDELTVTIGAIRDVAEGTYGYGATDPTLLTLGEPVVTVPLTDPLPSDFLRGDPVLIALPDDAGVTALEAESNWRSAVHRFAFVERGGIGDDPTDSLYLREGMPEALTVGEDSGWRCQNLVHRVTLDAEDHLADLGQPLRLTVTYERADGLTVDQVLLLAVVLHPPILTLDVPGVQARWPQIFQDLHALTDATGAGMAMLLDTSWQAVLDDLRASKVKPEAVRDQTVFESAIALRARWLAAENGVIPRGWTPEAWDGKCASEYRAALRSAIGQITWYDDTEDDVPTDAELNRSGMRVATMTL